MQARTSGNINYVSVNNSSNTPLTANSTFTGTYDDVTIYKTVSVSVFTDVNSSINGFSIQFSSNGSNWDYKYPFTVFASVPFAQTFQCIAPYFRVIYVNGTSSQGTFRLQSILLSAQSGTSKTSSWCTNNCKYVNISGPLDSFGDVSVTQKIPVVIMSFIYNINSELYRTTNVGSGAASVTANTSLLSLSSGTTLGSSSTVSSIAIIKYTPGSGLRAFVTPVFGGGITGTTQYAGIGNGNDGFYFGYSGTTFGIFYIRGGVTTFIAQSSWNGDQLNGNSINGSILDPTKGNVYCIQLQWLGYGYVKFHIESNGQSLLVHTILYPNTSTDVSLIKPGFYGQVKVSNDATTSNVSMKLSCIAIYDEGNSIYNRPGLRRSISNSVTGVANATPQYCLVIRNRSTFVSQSNITPVLIDIVSMSTDSNAPMRVSIVRDITNTITYTDISTNTSVIEYNAPGAPVTVTGGVEIVTFYLGKLDSGVINLTQYDIELFPSQVLAIVLYTTNTSNSCNVALSWREFI